MNLTKILLSLSAALLLASCASDPIDEPEPEQEFGSSVRNMVRAQTFNPLAGKASQPPQGMDGARAEAALEGYRGAQPVIVPGSPPTARQVWTKAASEGEGK